MNSRAYDPDRDLEAARRIWLECGWVEPDDFPAFDIFLRTGRKIVADVNGEAECMVITSPGSIRHLESEIPFGLVSAVTTSRVARKQGLAMRLTAQAMASCVAAGEVVLGLGMFEQGYYNKLGFGSGSYANIVAFDPARLRLPPGVRARPPRRLTAEDHEAVHANRLNRLRGHGSCTFPAVELTWTELAWGKSSFVLGYFDGEGGALSHHLLCTTEGNNEDGPYRIRWLAYETREQLLELLALIRSLGDQVRLMTMVEPAGVQLPDLIETPTRLRYMTKGSKFENQFRCVAWWQMRIADVEAALAATKLPDAGGTRFNLVLTDPIEGHLPDDAPWRGVAGSYVVRLGPESEARRGDPDAALPTLTASVNAFTRMWLGVRPATGLSVTDDLAGPAPLLEDLDRTLRLPTPDPDWDF